jgi:uncharacterized protein
MQSKNISLPMRTRIDQAIYRELIYPAAGFDITSTLSLIQTFPNISTITMIDLYLFDQTDMIKIKDLPSESRFINQLKKVSKNITFKKTPHSQTYCFSFQGRERTIRLITGDLYETPIHSDSPSIRILKVPGYFGQLSMSHRFYPLTIEQMSEGDLIITQRAYLPGAPSINSHIGLEEIVIDGINKNIKRVNWWNEQFVLKQKQSRKELEPILDKEHRRLKRLPKSASLIPFRNSDLMIYIKEGNRDAVLKWIKSGIDLNETNSEGDTYVMLAAKFGQAQIMEDLVKNGANINVQSDHGDSALMLAADNNQTSSVKKLIELGADPHIQNENGYTALMIAFFKHNTHNIQQLLESMTIVTQTSETGSTALMFAATTGNQEAVDSLIEKGAKVNRQDDEGKNALMNAASTGHTKIAQTLIDLGANINLNDKQGQTALSWATQQLRLPIVKILLSNNADTSIRDNKGRTALDWAKWRQNKAIQIELKKAMPSIWVTIGKTVRSGYLITKSQFVSNTADLG